MKVLEKSSTGNRGCAVLQWPGFLGTQPRLATLPPCNFIAALCGSVGRNAQNRCARSFCCGRVLCLAGSCCGSSGHGGLAAFFFFSQRCSDEGREQTMPFQPLLL